MKYLVLILAMACSIASAQTTPTPPQWTSTPFACLPTEAAPAAAGSPVFGSFNSVGWFYAWWCPGVDRPQVFAVRWDSMINPLSDPRGNAFIKDPHTQTANQLRLLGDDIDGPRLGPIWRPSMAKILAARPK